MSCHRNYVFRSARLNQFDLRYTSHSETSAKGARLFEAFTDSISSISQLKGSFNECLVKSWQKRRTNHSVAQMALVRYPVPISTTVMVVLFLV